MTLCDHFKQETPWDPFQGTLEEYPDIQNYVSHFQVELKSSKAGKSAKLPRHFKDSIVVFKKKRLPIETLHSHSNIYEHDPRNLELDVLDQNKSRFSCLRCRKFKKKCTRDLPECLNCVSCDELCIYNPRKRKDSVESSTSVDTEKRVSVSSAPDSCPSRSGSLGGMDSYFDNGQNMIRRRFSMPIKLPTGREPVEQREMYYDYGAVRSTNNSVVNSNSKSPASSRRPSKDGKGSNLYKLLN